MSVFEKIKNDIVESQVWKAIFRHGYDDTPRNRVMMVTSNVFLHLHPAKVRRHAVRMRFTWCMGGLTFLMFLITAITGIYLMFYYRPVAEYAYADRRFFSLVDKYTGQTTKTVLCMPVLSATGAVPVWAVLLSISITTAL